MRAPSKADFPIGGCLPRAASVHLLNAGDLTIAHQPLDTGDVGEGVVVEAAYPGLGQVEAVANLRGGEAGNRVGRLVGERRRCVFPTAVDFGPDAEVVAALV